MDNRPLIEALSAEIKEKNAEFKKARDDWAADQKNEVLKEAYKDLKEGLDSLYEQRKILLSAAAVAPLAHAGPFDAFERLGCPLPSVDIGEGSSTAKSEVSTQLRQVGAPTSVVRWRLDARMAYRFVKEKLAGIELHDDPVPRPSESRWADHEDHLMDEYKQYTKPVINAALKALGKGQEFFCHEFISGTNLKPDFQISRRPRDGPFGRSATAGAGPSRGRNAIVGAGPSGRGATAGAGPSQGRGATTDVGLSRGRSATAGVGPSRGRSAKAGAGPSGRGAAVGVGPSRSHSAAAGAGPSRGRGATTDVGLSMGRNATAGVGPCESGATAGVGPSRGVPTSQGATTTRSRKRALSPEAAIPRPGHHEEPPCGDGAAATEGEEARRVFGEMKMPHVLKAVAGNKAQAFIKAYEAHKPSENNPQGGPIWQALQQEWGYMRMGPSNHGFLIDYKRTWFLYTHDGLELQISDAFPFGCGRSDVEEPSIPQMLMYLILKELDSLAPPSLHDMPRDISGEADEDARDKVPTPESRGMARNTRSQAQRRRSTQQGGASNEQGAEEGKGKRTKASYLPMDALQTIRPLGMGETGVTWLARVRGIDAAFKAVDVFNTNNEVKLLETEAATYRALGALQGHCIPRMISHGYCWGGMGYFVATELLPGMPAHKCPTSTLRHLLPAVEQGLSGIHAAGCAHGDVRLENVIVQPSAGKAFFIDFGRSFAAPTAAQKEAEMQQLRCLFLSNSPGSTATTYPTA